MRIETGPPGEIAHGLAGPIRGRGGQQGAAAVAQRLSKNNFSILVK
jgi:hypothetical protein